LLRPFPRGSILRQRLAVRAFVCDACSPTLLHSAAAQDLLRDYYGGHDH